MTVRIAAGVVFLVGFSVCGILSTIVGIEVVDRVNEKLPEAQRFDTLQMGRFKWWQLRRYYKRLYPDGPLVRKLDRIGVAFLGCLLISAACFGIL
jgi:hypothetical protein